MFAYCIKGIDLKSVCDFCGNGITKNLVETCDDGTLDDEGCASDC